MEPTEIPLFKFLGVHFGQFPEHYDIEVTRVLASVICL